jgi:tRNA (guanine-N7-)-methyltransferase
MEESRKGEAENPPPPRKGLRSFVLRAGRMTQAQKHAYETLLPRYEISRRGEPLDFARAFGNTNPVIIEIGFGMGITTAEIAQNNPGINYLGIEVHRPGIGRFLWEADKRNLRNVRVIEGDAVEALERTAPESVRGFHLFFPDPWPKKRHHKRRLITRPFTDMLADRLEKGGFIYMATDWADYGLWALRELSATPSLENPWEAENRDGFAPPLAWRPRTKFEQKGLAKNHEIRELYFVKKGIV